MRSSTEILTIIVKSGTGTFYAHTFIFKITAYALA